MTRPQARAETEGALYGRIGERVAQLRRDRGWTQERLAEQADIGSSYVARIETGQRRPTIGTLAQIAAAIGVPLACLFDDASPSKRSSKASRSDSVDGVLATLSPADRRLIVRVAGRIARRQRRT